VALPKEKYNATVTIRETTRICNPFFVLMVFLVPMGMLDATSFYALLAMPLQPAPDRTLLPTASRVSSLFIQRCTAFIASVMADALAVGLAMV